MTEESFLWLLKWYYDRCDGDWEHGSRIHIGTIDNPGWSLTINLEATELENHKFQKIKWDKDENDWLCCFIQGNNFEGRCGPINLPQVLQVFREWAEKYQEETK